MKSLIFATLISFAVIATLSGQVLAQSLGGSCSNWMIFSAPSYKQARSNCIDMDTPDQLITRWVGQTSSCMICDAADWSASTAGRADIVPAYAVGWHGEVKGKSWHLKLDKATGLISGFVHGSNTYIHGRRTGSSFSGVWIGEGTSTCDPISTMPKYSNLVPSAERSKTYWGPIELTFSSVKANYYTKFSGPWYDCKGNKKGIFTGSK